MKSTDIYDLYEAKITLLEVEMSTSNLRKLASKIKGARVGIEFEMVVPGYDEDEDEDEDEVEPDYDMDESVADIDDIIRFFDNGDVNTRSDLRQLRDELLEAYSNYQYSEASGMWYDEGRDFFAEYVKDNVSEEEVAEYLDLPEDLLGDRVPDDDDWDRFIEENWKDQTDLYNSAREEFIQDKLDEGDFYEEDFLRSIGLETMQDVQERFYNLISWPYYTQVERSRSSGQSTIKEIAEDFGEFMGKEVIYSDRYHGADRKPNAYTIEPDSSIKHGHGELGLEFISYPMTIDEMLEDIKKIKEWAKQNNCRTNKSTGLHMNVSVPGYSLRDLDYVKLAVLIGDNYILNRFDRIGNDYANAALTKIQSKSREQQTTEYMLEKLKYNMNEIASKLIHSGRTDKYTSINTKNEYVEFRSPGGNYLDKDLEILENTLLRFVVGLDAACDREKYKKEYYTKVYKLLKGGKNESATMSLFARYMSGELNVSDYAKLLNDKRQERYAKMGIIEIPESDADEGDWKVSYNDKTIYLKKTERLENESDVLKIIKKYKPSFSDTSKIEISRYSFGEDIKKLNLYQVDFSYNSLGVVAENEQQAREIVMMLRPNDFYRQPKMIDDNMVIQKMSSSPREIKKYLDWQTDKLEQYKVWTERPKIYYSEIINSIGSGSYIAATTYDNALNILKQLHPDVTLNLSNKSRNFALYVTDEYPSDSTYLYYRDRQNEKIEQLKNTSRDEPDQEYKLYKVAPTTNTMNYINIAARSVGEARRIAAILYPNLGDELDIELLNADPASINIFLRAQQDGLANINRRSRAISDISQYQVENIYNGVSMVLAATSESDAIRRAIDRELSYDPARLRATRIDS